MKNRFPIWRVDYRGGIAQNQSMPSLILTNNEMEQVIFPLGKAIMLIGRDPESGIHLEAHEISKNHASIVFSDGHYVIRDNGSTNGTFVNGKKTAEKTLVHDDKVSFGPYEFQVDMELEEPAEDVPSQKPTHLNRSGQEYRRSVTLEHVKGREATGPVQVMMAGTVPRARVQAAAPQKNPLVLWGFVMLALIGIVAIVGWLGQMRETDRLVEEQKTQKKELEALRQPLAASEPRIKKLQEELARTYAALRIATADLKKSHDGLAALQEQNFALDAKRKEALKSEQAAQAAEATKPAEPAKPAVAPLKLEPLQELPPLEYPPEIVLMEETQVAVMLADNVAGSRKVPAGRVFPVKGTDQEEVLVDMDGETVRISKDHTNFQSALDASNLFRKKENERLRHERELLIEKMMKDEALALEQAEKEKTELAAAMVSLSLKVEEVLAGGVLGTAGTGVKVFLSGIDFNNIAVSERWKGDAYPMGLFKKPGSNLKLRHYTADIKEFAAYKKSGAVAEEPAPVAEESAAKEIPKIGMAQLEKINELANPIRALNALKQIRKPAGTISGADAQRFVRNEAPKWKKAATLAGELSKNYRMSYECREWLKNIIVATEMCDADRLDPFAEQLRKIDKDWLDLKTAFLIKP